MRLRKLKLAGFKSFVDPTTVHFPSDLIGVVGPNGCGKSNVIDAVRWVMGESSAKQLRGDSMSDVVFNGSNTRKPVGQAAVEMIFDNKEGRLGGQYANYNEISVKRSVSREGQSHYYLNGAKCRRRDITDIFLGTGLGPRSYAIIEQGTISRIIEAKPEDLRVFLEEAAGISKYKERRKETETRIRHTRDNLDRLNDLREELEKQINHLQRQAKAAERYKILKEEERILNAQLQALKWQGLNDNAQGIETKIRDQETELEASRAKQRSIESDIETQREALAEANELFNKIQSQFYAVGSDIARLEQSIQHTRERKQQQQNDLSQLDKDLSEAQLHLNTDQNKIVELEQELDKITPASDQAEAAEQAAVQALQESESAMHTWQTQWEQFTQQAAEPARVAEVEAARMQQLEMQRSHLSERQTKLKTERDNNIDAELEKDLAELNVELESKRQTLDEKQKDLVSTQTEISSFKDQLQEINTRYDDEQENLQILRSKHASQVAVQKAALGKEQQGVKDWLQSENLEQAKRLAEVLDVEQGWEVAIECVLGAHLEAVCVDSLDALFNKIKAFSEGQLTLIEKAQSYDEPQHSKAVSLSSKIRTGGPSLPQLEGVYAVDNLNDALALRPRLMRQESVVTKDGLWLGIGWLRVIKQEESHKGVLQREQELKQLEVSIDELEKEFAKVQMQRNRVQDKLKQYEQQRDILQQSLQTLNKEFNEANGKASGLSSRYEQMQKRIQHIEHDLSELKTQIESAESAIIRSRENKEQAKKLIRGFEMKREKLNEQRSELQTSLEEARSKANGSREQAQQVRVRAESIRAELGSIKTALQRTDSQQNQLTTRREELNAAIKEVDQPLTNMSEELEGFLQNRVSIEATLNKARGQVQEIESTHRELDEARLKAEEGVQLCRGKLEETRIGWQETKVRRQTIQEDVQSSGFEVAVLIKEMPDDAEASKWQETVDSVERKISRLGAINLAAIEEFDQQTERKVYLDAQNDDLVSALKTLEDAIEKIDKETKTRFQDTFDKVNNGFKELFPRLFGGGKAYLEMTSENILDTGITVMARPPGKRNSTIHLLSGGEKALTAVAMVFAIFELNPAPFCMLDEVDAPLDDANVGRYCEMLKHMSDRIQFIFITHNKITMEIAEHLTGVTMHEPGVSRLVAVDVDEAVKLAAV